MTRDRAQERAAAVVAERSSDLTDGGSLESVENGAREHVDGPSPDRVDDRSPSRAKEPAPGVVDERARRLEAAIAELGLQARVESRDALAIIALADDTSPPLDAVIRRACVREAQRVGFTHVALEISPRPQAP